MMDYPKRNYYAKILLFGEYTVILGSEALAVPFRKFSGTWSLKGEAKSSMTSLLWYLKQNKPQFSCKINLDPFEYWIGRGLVFHSDIPIGYGAGSSGALSAAIFDLIVDESTSVMPMDKIVKNLGIIESYYHGSSSGLDPMVSWLNSTILIKKNKEYEQIQVPVYPNNTFELFLIDTQIPRSTSNYVSLFKEKLRYDQFKFLCTHQLNQFNNLAITHFLEENFRALFEDFDRISQFQYHHFSEMIPKPYQNIWEEGLDGDDFKLKLCGAGGGGYILGMRKSECQKIFNRVIPLL